MMEGLPELKPIWKRPADVKFPTVWHRFETKPKNGKVFKIRIEDLTEDRTAEVIDFVMKYFFTEEPLCVASKLLEDKPSTMIYQYILNQMIAQNVSIIAVIDDNSSNPEIVGLQILSVASPEDPEIPELQAEAIKKLRNFYVDTKEDYNPFDVIGCDCYLHDWGLCVASKFRRLGIALNILNSLSKIGQAYGLKGTMITFTRIESQLAAEKSGFKLYKEIVYSEYKDEKGNVIFPVESTKSLKFMGKLFKKWSTIHDNK